MTDELERSVELLERLLGDPQLRRRFRVDAAAVLTEAGLPELAAGLGHGGRALMTLEMRESRSSLAGVMVAAAAEGVDLARFADHAAPALARDAGDAIHQLMQHPHHAAPKPVHQAAPQPPAKPNFAAPAETPMLAQPEPNAPSPTAATVPQSQPAPTAAPTATATGAAQPEAASAAAPAALQTHSQGARLVTEPPGPAGHHGGGSPAGGGVRTRAPARRHGAGAGRPRAGRRRTGVPRRPGHAPADRRLDGRARGEGRAAAGAAGDGGAHRVGAAQPVLRRS